MRASLKAATIAGLTGMTLLLSSCSLSTLTSMTPHLPEPVKAARADEPAAPKVPVRPAVRKPGELDNGTARHILIAGGVQLTLNYWTADAAKSWTPASQGQIQMSAQAQGIKDKRTVQVTRLAVISPYPAKADVELIDDRGAFVVASPFSYNTAFQLPVYPKSAKSVKLRVIVDLQIETAPKSRLYSRITVNDSLYVPLAPIAPAHAASISQEK